MPIRTVAIFSPGDMGVVMGKVLSEHGLGIVTCVEGRSELTRLRAREVGFREARSYDEAVAQADLVLSIVPPAEAPSVAERVVKSLHRTGVRPVYADCNAVAPQTVKRIEAMISEVGAAFVDVGIIGPPPEPGSSTRFYCSGPDTTVFEELGKYGLDVRKVGQKVGEASGLKMVFAASTKGTTALWTELLVAARALGLEESLLKEFAIGRLTVSKALMGRIPSMPRRARRWVSEMEEIAATFEAIGLTPRMLQGAADMYRFVGDTPLADQTSREPDPSLDAVLESLSRTLRGKAGVRNHND